jgi:hypothetical protein
MTSLILLTSQDEQHCSLKMKILTGTPAKAASICCPHPAHVHFLQFWHFTLRHILVLLVVEKNDSASFVSVVKVEVEPQKTHSSSGGGIMRKD